jgi:hypothetical protein
MWKNQAPTSDLATRLTRGLEESRFITPTGPAEAAAIGRFPFIPKKALALAALIPKAEYRPCIGLVKKYPCIILLLLGPNTFWQYLAASCCPWQIPVSRKSRFCLLYQSPSSKAGIPPAFDF